MANEFIARNGITSLGNIVVSGSITTTGTVAISGSFASSSFAATASSADNFLTRGTLTAQTLVVQTITSSVMYSSGSNIFGNNIANTQVLTGSVTVTGSLAVVTNGTEFQVTSTGVKMGNVIGDNHTITGSMYVSGAFYTNASGSGDVLDIQKNQNAITHFYFRNTDTTNASSRAYLNVVGGTNRISLYSLHGDNNYLNMAYGNFYIQMNTSSSVINPLFISSSGNVGIGIITPSQPLHVYSTTTTTSTFFETNAVNSYIGLKSTSGITYIGNVSSSMTFEAGGSERMRIASNGLVSIANTFSSSNYKLGVSSSAYINGTNNKGIFITDNATYASIVGLNKEISAYNKLEIRASGTDGQIMLHTNGNVSIGNSTDTGDQLYLAGNLKMVTNGKIDSNGGYLSINSGTGGNVGIGVASPSYKFHMSGGQYFLQATSLFSSYTSDGLWGTTAAPSFIGSPGQVGSSSRYGVSGILLGYQDNGSGLYSPAYGFEVKSTDGRPVTGNVVKAIVLKDTDSNTLVFYVNNNGNVLNVNNSYGSTSDISIKENIVDATPKLSNLMNVKIRNYNLKADPIKIKQIGVVAQELEEVFPGMVETDTEGLKSVKYSVFVPMLIKAIQELTTRVQYLENK